MRIAKFIASCGICSRRAAEQLILDGRVSINGELISSPALNIETSDEVKIDGKIIENNGQTRLWLYHKPPGLVTSHRDEQGRPTVFDNLKGLPRVISVGRLDLNSEGLLLLTNNGDLARKLELPANKFDRKYLVRAFGNPEKLLAHGKEYRGDPEKLLAHGKEYRGDPEKLLAHGKEYRDNPEKLLAHGKEYRIDSINYQFKSIKQTSKTGRNSWFEIVLQQGKNREIRRVFEYFRLTVNRLIRTEYAGYQLGKLEAGRHIEVPQNKLR